MAEEPLIQLGDIDHEALLGLSPSGGHDRVRSTLRDIAKRHGTDWERWSSWTCGLLGSDTVLSWLSTQFEGDAQEDGRLGQPCEAYQALAAFAFQRFLPTLHGPLAICELFKRFADSIHQLGKAEAMSGTEDRERFRNRACDALAMMMVAAGPAGSRHALAAMNFATFDKLEAWLGQAWGTARGAFEAAAFDDVARVPGKGGGAERRKAPSPP